MKNHADIQTAELLPTPRPRGRPVTGQAKSAAERMRAYRARKRAGEVGLQVNSVTMASVTKNTVDPSNKEQREFFLRTVMDENKILGKTVTQLRKQLARAEHDRDEALAKARAERGNAIKKESPMTNDENLILEHLKALRNELRDFKTQTMADLSLIKLRLTSLES
jgi:hypothetical protein